MGCDTVFALPATLSTASSLDSTPTNGRRITLQPNLLVATRPALYMRRLAPHSTLARPQHHASSSHRGNTPHTSLVVFHVQFEVLLANGIDLHLYGICDTVQANRGIWHTSQQRDKRVGFQFPLIISAFCVIVSRPSTTLQTAAFSHRSRSSRSDIGVPS